MRKKLITRRDAIEAIKTLVNGLPKDSRINGERINAEITETLFCLRHQEDGVDLFGADMDEALFITANYRGTKDYTEKKKRQMELSKKYAFRIRHGKTDDEPFDSDFLG